MDLKAWVYDPNYNIQFFYSVQRDLLRRSFLKYYFWVGLRMLVTFPIWTLYYAYNIPKIIDFVVTVKSWLQN